MDEKQSWQDLAATLQIFGYETDGKTDSILWTNPRYFRKTTGQQGKILDSNYETWIESKRIFTENEVTIGKWIKISNLKSAYEVQLLPYGMFTEHPLFDETNTWDGTWEVKNGILALKTQGFTLVIFASKEGSIHSGIEFEGQQIMPYAYFKVIHLV